VAKPASRSGSSVNARHADVRTARMRKQQTTSLFRVLGSRASLTYR